MAPRKLASLRAIEQRSLLTPRRLSLFVCSFFLSLKKFLFRDKISPRLNEDLSSATKKKGGLFSERAEAQAWVCASWNACITRREGFRNFCLPRHSRTAKLSCEACGGSTWRAGCCEQTASVVDESHPASTVASGRRVHAGH